MHLPHQLLLFSVWSGSPFPPPGDLPDPGTEPGSPTLQADTLPPEPPGKSGLRHKRTHYLFYLSEALEKINLTYEKKQINVYSGLGTRAAD